MVNVHHSVRLIFFNDRPSLPSSFANAKADTMMGPEIEASRAFKSDWTREIEVDVVLSLEMAQNLIDILQPQLNALRQKQDASGEKS